MTEEPDPEISAMQSIHKAIDKLDLDSKKRVIKYIIDKHGLHSVSPTNTETKPPLNNTPSQSAIDKNISIKDFISLKKPTNNYQKICCYGYFLEHFENIKEFKTEQLSKANTDARQPKVSSMSVFVNDACQKYGFLTPTSKGMKALSSRGEAIVNALPDQTKVKEVLETIPHKRKRSAEKGEQKAK
jgi:hypothetical protein